MSHILPPFSLNLRGRLVHFGRPAVMGIINVTPDSFYAPSRAGDDIRGTVRRLLSQGADIIDIGACSTRPGAVDVGPEEEIRRLRPAMATLRQLAPDAIVSVDTYHSRVARVAVLEMGADIVNDISGGTIDPEMIPTVAELGVPYVMMHTRGTPSTMSALTDYPDGVTATVIREMLPQVRKCREAGIADLIVDPGFGFAKTVEQNYRLLRDLDVFGRALDCPVLAGVSRKSMITRPLEIAPEQALEGTVAANTLALERGAAILRVHDVLAAAQTVRIHQALANA